MAQRDAQKSEIHEATDDSTASPANPALVTGGPGVGGEGAADTGGTDTGGTDAGPLADDGRPKGELAGTHIVSDESDFGGPITIEDDKIPDPAPARLPEAG